MRISTINIVEEMEPSLGRIKRIQEYIKIYTAIVSAKETGAHKKKCECSNCNILRWGNVLQSSSANAQKL